MSVIAFPVREPRTSPHVEPAGVAVNVTPIDRESVREMFNEARIRVLGNAWKGAFTAHNPAAERMYWDAYTDAVSRRSRQANKGLKRGCQS